MAHITKLQQLRDKWAGGDPIGALRIAAKFPSLGQEKEDITRAWAAHTNPVLYTQMGHNPERLVERGLHTLQRKYNLQPKEPLYVDA